MKRAVIGMAVLAMLVIAATSYAGVKWTKDLADNADMNYVELTCPKKSWPVGVAYIDRSSGDTVDAVTVVCRDKRGIETPTAHRDFENTNQAVLKLTCPSNEEFIGIYYEDMKRGDAMDGVTAVCKGASGRHQVYNKDLENSKQGVEVTKDGKERISGIAYKDLEHSDKADGATIVTK